jgi:hypothetical protein
MDFGEGLHDQVPDASNPPTNEPVVAGRARSKALRTMGRLTAISRKMPLRTRRSLTLSTPRGLVRKERLMAVHSKSVEAEF